MAPGRDGSVIRDDLMKITLIGMAGVGKSIIGKALAKKLSFRFIDTDAIIEHEIGMGLQDIIDKLGEKEFLRIEERTLLALNPPEKCVISTGGSAVYSEMAMESLKKISAIVFLNASLDTIENWITDKVERGIIHLEKGLPGIYEERLPLYKKYAGTEVGLDQNYNRDFVVDEIIKKVKNNKGHT